VEVLKKHNVYDPKKVFGVSTLDVVRAQTFIGELKGLNPLNVNVRVIGGHSAETMIPLLSQVSGATFSPEEAKALQARIADAGTVVVDAKDGAGSATLSMAYAGARFTMSLVRALKGETGIVECAYVAVESQPVSFLAVPVELGREGVAKVLPVGSMNSMEQELWDKMIPVLQKNIQTGVEFANS